MKDILFKIYKPLTITTMTLFWLLMYTYLFIVIVAGLRSMMPIGTVTIQIIIIVIIMIPVSIVPVFISWSIFKQIEVLAEKYLGGRATLRR